MPVGSGWSGSPGGSAQGCHGKAGQMPDQAGHRQTGEGVRDLAGRVCPVFGGRALVQCHAGLGLQEVEPASDVHAERLFAAQPAGAPGSAVGGEVRCTAASSAVPSSWPCQNISSPASSRSGQAGPASSQSSTASSPEASTSTLRGQSRWQVNSRSPAMGVTRSARTRSKPACPAIASPQPAPCPRAGTVVRAVRRGRRPGRFSGWRSRTSRAWARGTGADRTGAAGP